MSALKSDDGKAIKVTNIFLKVNVNIVDNCNIVEERRR